MKRIGRGQASSRTIASTKVMWLGRRRKPPPASCSAPTARDAINHPRERQSNEIKNRARRRKSAASLYGLQSRRRRLQSASFDGQRISRSSQERAPRSFCCLGSIFSTTSTARCWRRSSRKFAPPSSRRTTPTRWRRRACSASAFLVTYMLTAPALGWLADRFSRWVIVGCAVHSLESGQRRLRAWPRLSDFVRHADPRRHRRRRLRPGRADDSRRSFSDRDARTHPGDFLRGHPGRERARLCRSAADRRRISAGAGLFIWSRRPGLCSGCSVSSNATRAATAIDLARNRHARAGRLSRAASGRARIVINCFAQTR